MRDQEQIPAFESEEEGLYRRSTLLMRCLIVGGAYLSFAASVAALLLNWSIPTHVPSWFPHWLIYLIENNRIATLLLPLLCLFVCYCALRYITGDILARPERYLDERQKMLRDQVHRSAYKVLKSACLVVPIAILLYSLFWSAPAPSPTPVRPSPDPMTTGYVYIMLDSSPNKWLTIDTPDSAQPVALTISANAPDGQTSNEPASQGIIWEWERIPSVAPQPVATPRRESWLSGPTNIGLFFATCLLSLFLMVSALPMSLLVCKEKD